MDDALRCLRDGVVSGRSVPFVLVQDPLDVLGGPDLAAKVACLSRTSDRDYRSINRVLHMSIAFNMSWLQRRRCALT